MHFLCRESCVVRYPFVWIMTTYMPTQAIGSPTYEAVRESHKKMQLAAKSPDRLK
jgi:hypothetical protein